MLFLNAENVYTNYPVKTAFYMKPNTSSAPYFILAKI